MSLLHNLADAILNTTGVKTEEDIMMKLLITALILLLTVSGVSPACGRAEYLVGQECCPMCSPGSYIRRHCSQYGSTECLPCPSLTFTEALNELEACRPCRRCNSSAGLTVRRACTPSSDTLCEPLEGHYCTDPIKDGCRGAVEHTKCLPGQNIKQPGSASSDTVCGDCGNNTYSDGTFTSCRPHTQCVSLGLWTRTAGTHTADAECEMRRHHVVLLVLLATLCSAAVVVLLACWHRKHKQSVGVIV